MPNPTYFDLDNARFRNIGNREPSSFIEDHPNHRIIGMLIDHRNGCKFFNGFSVGRLTRGSNPVIIRCSCGWQFSMEEREFRMRYSNRDIEDVISEINYYQNCPIDIPYAIEVYGKNEAVRIKLMEEVKKHYCEDTKPVKNSDPIACLEP